MKPRNLKRAAFESAGWRTITIAHGQVKWPDGRVCRYNVRLQACAGSEGDITLIAEDINGGCRFIKLRRKI